MKAFYVTHINSFSFTSHVSDQICNKVNFILQSSGDFLSYNRVRECLDRYVSSYYQRLYCISISSLDI